MCVSRNVPERSHAPHPSVSVHPGGPVHSGHLHNSLSKQHGHPGPVCCYLPVNISDLTSCSLISSRQKGIVSWAVAISLSFYSRFVCCAMVAVPLAATVLIAIIKWQLNREVSPGVESSSLSTNPNMYGTLMHNGSPSVDINHCTLQQLNQVSETDDNHREDSEENSKFVCVPNPNP